MKNEFKKKLKEFDFYEMYASVKIYKPSLIKIANSLTEDLFCQISEPYFNEYFKKEIHKLNINYSDAYDFIELEKIGFIIKVYKVLKMNYSPVINN